MHVARFATDHTFIDFNFAGQLSAMLALLGKPDAVKHKPRGLLSHAQRPRDLATANTILSIQDQPHCRKPLIQTNRGIFKNGSDFNRELALGVMDAALPSKLIFEEANFVTATCQTNHTISPFGTGERRGS
jgi:hypothetical protein